MTLQGERFRVVEAPYKTLLTRRRQFQGGNDAMMTNDFTCLVIGELEQNAKLGPQDTALINKKIDLLAQKVINMTLIVSLFLAKRNKNKKKPQRL